MWPTALVGRRGCLTPEHLAGPYGLRSRVRIDRGQRLIAGRERVLSAPVTICHTEPVSWSSGLIGVLAGLLITLVTVPVGVSGAVFLLPVQFSVLGVPSPSVTPTNLVFNAVAGPGALLRYRKAGNGSGPLTRRLVLGTLPGVVAGAVIRVFAVPGPQAFRLVVGLVLLPLGAWVCVRALRPARRPRTAPSGRFIIASSLAVGVVGGIYGIGGGSLLGPILAGRGLPVSAVAPAALASTFLTSVLGVGTYAVLAITTGEDVGPDWTLGLLCGLGGLLGGYLGARLQPRLPETALRITLGTLAAILGGMYIAQAFG